MELKRQIEAYFDYRWANDRNQTQNESGDRFMEELPEQVQDALMSTYLYKEFISAFSFQIPRPSEHRHSRFAPAHLTYRNLMVELMKNLEPMRFAKGQVLMNELDPHLEVFFIMNDPCAVGFTINHV